MPLEEIKEDKLTIETLSIEKGVADAEASSLNSFESTELGFDTEENSKDILEPAAAFSLLNKRVLSNSIVSSKDCDTEEESSEDLLAMPDIECLQGGLSGGNGACKVCSGVIVVILVGVFAVIVSSVHKIEEGNVGVYYKYGAIMDTITRPGIHYMTPFVVDVYEIQIRPQTDVLEPMQSVTKDGIQNSFKEVQVITRIREDKLVFMIKNFGRDFKRALVYDRIKEELRIFCANSTVDEVYNTKFLEIVNQVKENVINSIIRLGDNGLEVLNLVVPKPEIPDDIAHNYKQVKVQWTEQLVATQAQKTESIKKETEKIRAIADAERNKAVLQIKIQEKIIEKEGEMNISLINNNILKAKEENIANIEKYKIEKQAEANKALYTPEYVQLNMAKTMSNNTKYYFSGQESVFGGLMSKIFNGN